MTCTPSFPGILENPGFAFDAELLASIKAERSDAAADLGPTDALSEECQILEYDLFYGPLLPDALPLPSPSSSRSASPAPQVASASSQITKPAISSRPPEAATRSGNSKSRRNKEKSSQNRAATRRKQQEERRGDPYKIRTSSFLNHIVPAVPTHTQFDLNSIPVASTGFVALPDVDGGDTCAAEELVRRHGCRYIPWDGL